MTTIHLQGRITESGELQCDLPTGLPPGEARITIEIGRESEGEPRDQKNPLQVVPMTGAELVNAGLLGGWEDLGITDSSEWVEEQRRLRRERRGW